MAQPSKRESSIRLTTIVGRRFVSPGVPASAAEAVAALRAASPDLVHEVVGMTWIGHRLPDRGEASKAEIEAATAAIQELVRADLLGHAELASTSICRVETDR